LISGHRLSFRPLFAATDIYGETLKFFLKYSALIVVRAHEHRDLGVILLPFRNIPNNGRLAGYAGPPGRGSAEVITKYIIVDMYAKAVQGMPAEDAVEWAHEELVKIYS
jgi:hypothetical protein